LGRRETELKCGMEERHSEAEQRRSLQQSGRKSTRMWHSQLFGKESKTDTRIWKGEPARNTQVKNNVGAVIISDRMAKRKSPSKRKKVKIKKELFQRQTKRRRGKKMKKNLDGGQESEAHELSKQFWKESPGKYSLKSYTHRGSRTGKFAKKWSVLFGLSRQTADRTLKKVTVEKNGRTTKKGRVHKHWSQSNSSLP